jgi:ribonuclease P protein component
MLPKFERIGSDRFNEIIEQGRTVRSNVLYTRFEQNTEKRFAVVIPKKLEKSAVKRHFFKRRIFASLAKVKDSFPDGDYIIFATPEVKGVAGQLLDTVLEDLGKKVAVR